MAAQLRSFVDVAVGHHFPIQNLPFSAGVPVGKNAPRCVTRIGDFIVDLAVLEAKGLFSDLIATSTFSQPTLNAYMALGRSTWKAVRSRLQDLLSSRGTEEMWTEVLSPVTGFQYSNPVFIPDYTDFYASKNHAYNVGVMFRGPETALQPNWTRLPVGYHGRASSVLLSGTPVIRPKGQIKPPDAPDSVYSVCRKLDFELEMGFFVGAPVNQIGHPMSIAEAKEAIFGVVLLNDWSARDIQSWEYVPLGPFTAKNFLTTISPWVVTLEALEPFKAPLPEQSPQPCSYLQDPELSAYDIHLSVKLRTAQSSQSVSLSESNLTNLYWSFSQQLAHHTVTGCNMRTGDLLGTGTISGPTDQSLGSLLEISLGGKRPITLPNGEVRSFLEDGDELTLTGECRGEGFVVGFGECTSTILPSLP